MNHYASIEPVGTTLSLKLVPSQHRDKARRGAQKEERYYRRNKRFQSLKALYFEMAIPLQINVPKVAQMMASEHAPKTVVGPSREAVRDKIIDIVRSHDVVIFVESNSPRCDEVKELFRSEEFAAVDVRIKNVERSNAKELFQEELWQLTKQFSHPHVWVNGRCLGGLSQTKRAHRCGDLAFYLSDES